MKHYTILDPTAVAHLLDGNDDFRRTVRKTLSNQVVHSFDSLLHGNWYDPSIETLMRVTGIAATTLGIDITDHKGIEVIIAPSDIAEWLKNNRHEFFAIAHYVDCSRGAIYHYEKTGRDTLSYSITAGISDFIHEQQTLKEKQKPL